VSEFFKPEDLFCVMNDTEVEKEAEQNFRNFKLDNESVHCPYAGTLHLCEAIVLNLPAIKRAQKGQIIITRDTK